ncbi:hypothetical protein ABZ807_17230 [Micromonospora sp. NPDC047548]|uniref:diacylglycerol/lipid kinase family protein n=1 Tax=Micromonospora sp. NPDC047548 TaxID=3155624 RepID=UPI0033E04411
MVRHCDGLLTDVGRPVGVGQVPAQPHLGLAVRLLARVPPSGAQPCSPQTPDQRVDEWCTTNNFARTVGIPLDLNAAVTVLADGKVIDVDLGLVGDMRFTNHVGIGLSADVMLKARPWLKRATGRLAYPITALALLARHRPLRATVRADGRKHEFVTDQLYVANGGFHAGRPITTDANADDRLLVAYPVGGPTRRELLRDTARNAATGDRRTFGDEPFLAVCQVWLETDPPAPVEVDGELYGETPIRIGLDPNALRVMAPADSPDR